MSPWMKPASSTSEPTILIPFRRAIPSMSSRAEACPFEVLPISSSPSIHPLMPERTRAQETPSSSRADTAIPSSMTPAGSQRGPVMRADRTESTSWTVTIWREEVWMLVIFSPSWVAPHIDLIFRCAQKGRKFFEFIRRHPRPRTRR